MHCTVFISDIFISGPASWVCETIKSTANYITLVEGPAETQSEIQESYYSWL